MAGPASDLNVAGHGARQPPRDGKPQSGSALAALECQFGLFELAEQSSGGLGSNADPRILHRNRQRDLAHGGFAWMRRRRNRDEHAARIGEFDSIADEVGDDLAQPNLVPKQMPR